MSVKCSGFCLIAVMAVPAAAGDVLVLLPQTGPAAKAGTAVRDGLLAGYYQTGGARNASLVLQFRDTATPTPVPTLIENALTPATRVVIGPLLREQVAELTASPPPVPVLALNRVENASTPGIWEFALSPEEEMPPLVNLMRQEGITQPHILMLADEPGERLRQSFQSAWTTTGGQPPPVHVLTENEQGGISASVRQLLQLPPARRPRALFLASPQLAVQLLPLLAFYQQQPVPVYTTSTAFDEIAPALQRRDLNGLRFCGTPWLTDNRWPEKTVLDAAATPESGSFNRLHAFGADAWHLQALLPAPKPISQPLRTGRIDLDPHGLKRTPLCMEILDGTATALTPGARPGR